MAGIVCAVPVPGIIAVILGWLALSQMRESPNSTGRGLAIAGIVLGAVNLAFVVFGFLFFVLSAAFG
jgi:predicted acyltransferase